MLRIVRVNGLSFLLLQVWRDADKLIVGDRRVHGD